MVVGRPLELAVVVEVGVDDVVHEPPEREALVTEEEDHEESQHAPPARSFWDVPEEEGYISGLSRKNGIIYVGISFLTVILPPCHDEQLASWLHLSMSCICNFIAQTEALFAQHPTQLSHESLSIIELSLASQDV